MAKTTGMAPFGARRDQPTSIAPVRPVAPVEPKRPFNPVQFLREVRAEARKVTWTSWKETWITSVMVAIMVILTAFFFFGVDALLHAAVTALLNLANAE
ncbi:MAG: preprotein translocase subunit SecE [Caulobacteraceae bacterium]